VLVGGVAQWWNVGFFLAKFVCPALDLHLMSDKLWVNLPLQVSQLGQLSLSSFWGQ